MRRHAHGGELAAVLACLMVASCGPEVEASRDPSMDPDPDPCFELPFEECIGECQWFWLLEGDCGYEALGCFGPSRCERDLDCASWQSCITVEKRTCGPHPLEPAVCLSCGVTPVQLCLPGAEPT